MCTVYYVLCVRYTMYYVYGILCTMCTVYYVLCFKYYVYDIQQYKIENILYNLLVNNYIN